MSVKELVIIQDGDKLKLTAPIKENGECWYSLSLSAKNILLDHNQAHLLMIWLQEHLK